MGSNTTAATAASRIILPPGRLDLCIAVSTTGVFGFTHRGGSQIGSPASNAWRHSEIDLYRGNMPIDKALAGGWEPDTVVATAKRCKELL
jgi:hypothetical protein